MVDFGKYQQNPSFLDISTSLTFSVLRQFCVSASLEMLDAKIGSVPVCCVVASLAFPASPASG